MPRRKSGQQSPVEEHGARRLEAAQPVLVTVEIHAGLDAYRSVDIAHERRRHLDVRNATPVGGGDEADDVRQNAAANGDDRLIAPMYREGVERPQHLLPRLERLGVLSAGKNLDFCGYSVAVEIISDPNALMAVHALVDDDKTARIDSAPDREQGTALRIEDIVDVAEL